MTPLLKKIIAFGLTVCFVMSAMPLEILLANLQSNVTNVSIDLLSSSAPNYKVKLEWNNPSWSTQSDSKAIPADSSTVHTPTGYRVLYRNATKGDKTTQQFADIPAANAAALPAQAEVAQILTSGTMYAYSVVPHHSHSYPAAPVPIVADAPMDNSTPVKEALLMTNLEVAAQGSGTTLTVTWDNPLVDGADPFTGYRIYYQANAKITDSLSNFSGVRTIPMTDSSLIRTKDLFRDGVQRLTYVVNDITLDQGSIYAVRVEPIYMGQEVRNNVRDSSNILTIAGKLYSIAFSTKDLVPYGTNEASIKFPLKILESGDAKLNLSWQGISPRGTINRIEVMGNTVTDHNPPNDHDGKPMGTLFSAQAANVTTWQVDRPFVKTYYYLDVYIESRDPANPLPVLIKSELAVYDPSVVNITPNAPGISIATPAPGTDTSVPTSLTVVGDAFVRPPYNEAEIPLATDTPDGKRLIDTSLLYDMYITDAQANLDDQDNLPKVYDKVTYQKVVDPANLQKLKFTLTSYYTKDPTTGKYVEKKTFDQNKLYYIRAYAINPNGNGGYLYSFADDITYYIPTYQDTTAPKTLSKPPLKIRVTNGIADITKDHIGLEWQTTWSEVFNKANSTWETNVAVAYTNNQLSFLYGREAQQAVAPYQKVDFATSNTNVYALFANTLTSIGYLDKTLTDDQKIAKTKEVVLGRTVTLGDDVEYEVFVKKESVVNSQTDYDAYAAQIAGLTWQPLKKATGAAAGGMQIDTSVSGTMYTQITQYNNTDTTIAPLDPNTTYQIFLRPYRPVGGLKGQASFIFGTTLPLDTSLVVTPTVPNLKQVDISDTTCTIKWPVQASGMKFLLAYSDRALDDPSKADYQITSDMIDKDGVLKLEGADQYLNYQLTGLFPETNYYVWVQAFTTDPVTGAIVSSEWSNPLYIQTSTVKPQSPPKGLGLASKQSLDLLNAGATTKLSASDSTYVVMEWFKDAYDTSGAVTPAASTTTATGYNILGNANILETCLVQFTGLNAMTHYFVRVKTSLTLTQAAKSPTVRAYTYTIQFSADDTFTDSTVVTISTSATTGTGTGTAAAGSKTLTVESDWSTVVKVITAPSTGDFDTDKNPDLYPLPDDDYEITYDRTTGTLNYRFRTNKEDANKNDDQLVDQRFISKLVKNNTFVHAIDLTKSEKFSNPSTRTVQIPYSIMEAMGQRNIAFQLTANNMIIKFPPNFIKNEQIKTGSTYGSDATVTISVVEMPTNVPPISGTQALASIAQKVSVSVATKTGVIQLKNTEKDMSITMKLNNNAITTNKNVGLFVDTDTTDKWQRTNGVFDAPNKLFLCNTKTLGSYAIIADTLMATSSDIQNANATNSVMTRMNINNSSALRLDAPVTSDQFNNIVSAVANGKKDVDMNAPLSQVDFAALKRSNLLVMSNTMSREQGVSTLVKLYESKTKARIAVSGSVGTSSYTDIKNADPKYQTDLLKAASIGFFKQGSANPKAALTLGDMLYMVDIIMLDSGMQV